MHTKKLNLLNKLICRALSFRVHRHLDVGLFASGDASVENMSTVRSWIRGGYADSCYPVSFKLSEIFDE